MAKKTPSIQDNGDGTITLPKADYNALIDRLANAYKIVTDCDELFKALHKTAGDGSRMIDSGLKGAGDPNPPVSPIKVP